MDSRVFVPTALHAELTEYTNLVRVLRTTRTLDLTTHLLQHAEQKDKDPDTWTPWPLIDCLVPEWSLQDEIKQLGETVVRKQTQAAREVDPADDHDELDSDSDSDSLTPAATRHLVFHTGAVLVHILNLMADQRPSAPGSMQNRLWAMNWEDVISLLAVSGAVHPTVIARAEKRLEHIYGPSTTKASERLKSATSAKARFSTWTSTLEDQLVAPPVLLLTQRNKRPRSYKTGGKSRALVDTDTDTDA